MIGARLLGLTILTASGIAAVPVGTIPVATSLAPAAALAAPVSSGPASRLAAYSSVGVGASVDSSANVGVGFAYSEVRSPDGIPYSTYTGGQSGARIRLADGELLVRSGDADWGYASQNYVLIEGDNLWTDEDSRGEIELAGGARVRMAQTTRLDLNRLQDKLILYLRVGSVIVCNPGGRSGKLLLDTPTGRITVKKAARLRVDVASDGATRVTVLSGRVTAEAYGQRSTVESGYRTYIEDGEAPSIPIYQGGYETLTGRSTSTS